MTAAAGARIIGIGNRWRRDDGVGLAVAAALRSELPPGMSVTTTPADCAALLHACEDCSSVWFVDALRGGGEPGSIRRLAGHGLDPWLAGPFGLSGHGGGLAQALALGRALGRLPARLVIYGIEGADFGFGETLSPAVAAAVPQVRARLLEELASQAPAARSD